MHEGNGKQSYNHTVLQSVLDSVRSLNAEARVRDRSGKPAARHERGLAAESPTAAGTSGFMTIIAVAAGTPYKSWQWQSSVGSIGDG